jgi:hypothetical protein
VKELSEGEAEDCPVLHGNLRRSLKSELVIFVVLNFGTARLLVFRKQLGWQLFSQQCLNSKQIDLLDFSFFHFSVFPFLSFLNCCKRLWLLFYEMELGSDPC